LEGRTGGSWKEGIDSGEDTNGNVFSSKGVKKGRWEGNYGVEKKRGNSPPMIIRRIGEFPGKGIWTGDGRTESPSTEHRGERGEEIGRK